MVNLSDIILARKDAITPTSVMRILDSAHKDNQPTLFKIVADLATAQMVPSLIAFSRNADWEGRYCIAQTIARFSARGPRRCWSRHTSLALIRPPTNHLANGAPLQSRTVVNGRLHGSSLAILPQKPAGSSIDSRYIRL